MILNERGSSLLLTLLITPLLGMGALSLFLAAKNSLEFTRIESAKEQYDSLGRSLRMRLAQTSQCSQTLGSPTVRYGTANDPISLVDHDGTQLGPGAQVGSLVIENAMLGSLNLLSQTPTETSYSGRLTVSTKASGGFHFKPQTYGLQLSVDPSNDQVMTCQLYEECEASTQGETRFNAETTPPSVEYCDGRSWVAVPSLESWKTIPPDNTVAGRDALADLVSGAKGNTATGYHALNKMRTGGYNSSIGVNSMSRNLQGSYNVAVGSGVYAFGSQGSFNTAAGVAGSLQVNSADHNTAIGRAALVNNGAGTGNTAVGQSALSANTSGKENTAVGNSFSMNTSGDGNTGIGAGAFAYNKTGSNNTGLGYLAGYIGSSGSWNTGMGFISRGDENTGTNGLGSQSSSRNTIFGFIAAERNSDGADNTGFGYQSLRYTLDGSRNTAVGTSAHIGFYYGSNNVTLGYGAGASNSIATANSSNNVFIGTRSGTGQSTDVSNSMIFGFQAPLVGNNASNRLDIGGVLLADLAQQRLSIGGAPLTSTLNVAGDLDVTGCYKENLVFKSGGACLSDRRLKRKISSLRGELEQISALHPVSFQWKENHLGKSGEEIGFIAQEVQKVIPDMVAQGEDGYFRIRYGVSLKIRMIQAFKELREQFVRWRQDSDQTFLAHQKRVNQLKAATKEMEQKSLKLRELIEGLAQKHLIENQTKGNKYGPR